MSGTDNKKVVKKKLSSRRKIVKPVPPAVTSAQRLIGKAEGSQREPVERRSVCDRRGKQRESRQEVYSHTQNHFAWKPAVAHTVHTAKNVKKI